MYNIGIDLGGTNIVAAIVSEDGLIIRKETIPTLAGRDCEEIIMDMAMLTVRLINKEGLRLSDIRSVGIGSPGIVDCENGCIVYASNLPFDNTPVCDIFRKYLRLPVFLANDANAAAYGEYASGVGAAYTDFVVITLGTGIGSGIVVNDKMLTGFYGGGAELGHMVIKADGVACSCGRRGCWEAYGSATALIGFGKEAAIANRESELYRFVEGDIERMTAKTVFDASDAGDGVAKKVIDRYLDDLALGIINIINIFQPQAIALGGGISAQKESLTNPLEKRLSSAARGRQALLKTEILTCSLGNDAGIIGAAMLHQND